MKTFEYTIKDELGIHARPAGVLVKEAKNFTSECTITKDGKTTLIPAIRQVVEETSLEKGEMRIRPMKGLFDDAD